MQAIGPLTRLWRRPEPGSGELRPAGGEQHYRDGLAKMRRGDALGALESFDKALARLPGLADAVVARAELLDSLGKVEAAREEYERARRLWAEMSPGAPDRRYLFRSNGHFAFEVEAYDLVRSRIKKKILPQLGHGNALLRRGQAREALESYEQALKVKPGLPEVLALKGEALSALGRYDEAIAAFDAALSALPSDAETLNARGIARMALGQRAEANDDWRRQLDLLPSAQAAARACVALRQGNYQVAFDSFGQAMAKEPANAYWPLYRLTSGQLLGAPADPAVVPADDRWPAPLLALRAGQTTEADLLARADTAGRRAEALLLLGVMARVGDPAAARRHWTKVVESGAPALIEYAVARNELARLGPAA